MFGSVAEGLLSISISIYRSQAINNNNKKNIRLKPSFVFRNIYLFVIIFSHRILRRTEDGSFFPVSVHVFQLRKTSILTSGTTSSSGNIPTRCSISSPYRVPTLSTPKRGKEGLPMNEAIHSATAMQLCNWVHLLDSNRDWRWWPCWRSATRFIHAHAVSGVWTIMDRLRLRILDGGLRTEVQSGGGLDLFFGRANSPHTQTGQSHELLTVFVSFPGCPDRLFRSSACLELTTVSVRRRSRCLALRKPT